MDFLVKNLKETVLNVLFPPNGDSSADELIREIKKPEVWGEKDIIALFEYKNPTAKKFIWKLKYKNNGEAAKLLAKIMHEEIMSCLNDWVMFENFEKPILIPVPISKEKLAKRGYNQTELLVEEILKLDEGENFEYVSETLKKTKDTPDQSSLKTKSARLKNLKGCFRVADPKKIKGRNIILIDDVITTGATIKETKKVLKEAGARKIKAFVVAH